MNQQELEALLQQIAPNNTPGRLVFGEDTQTVERAVPGEYAGAPPTKKQVDQRVLQWHDPGTGMTLRVVANPDGTYTKLSQGVDPKNQGQPATTAAQQAAAAGGTSRKPVQGKPGVYEVTTTGTDASGRATSETHYENDAGATVPTPTAAPQPQEVGGQWGSWDTTGPSPRWVPIPGGPQATPEQLNLPPTQRNAVFRDAQGNIVKTVKNPNYVKPSKIELDPAGSGRLINITEDDDGNTIVKPVDTSTVIKPADLPVLQARYGQLAQGLGTLAQDLNGRVARGEMTPQERTQAFTAAHQQAQTQVEEINSILDNSKAAWGQAIAQRGQTLGETASRRTFANQAFGNAFSGAMSLAQAGGGAASAGAFRELLGLQQRYAQGMGGFRDSPEIAMPASMQQVQGIGLPGYPMPGAAGAGPGAAPGAPRPGTSQPISNPDGSVTTERSITVTDPRLNGGRPTNIPSVWDGRIVSQDEAIDAATRSGVSFPSFGSIDDAVGAARQRSDDLGAGRLPSIGGASGVPGAPPPPPGGPAAAPRPWTDINAGPSIIGGPGAPAPGSPPGPPAAQTLPWTGGPTPPASTQPYTGQPGNPTLMGMGSQLSGGTFDPTPHVEGMLASNADPAWAEAVRRAAARMGYGSPGGYGMV
ncbi:MAG TPA: hypothetical protein VF076_07165 [Acidimicrobiales bacterium]